MAGGFHNHVVNVQFDTFAHQVAEDLIHQSLVGCSCVFKTERHDFVEVIGVICNESGFVHVGCGHGNLVVSRVCVKKTEDLVTSGAVDESVNIGLSVGISGTGFVKIGIINTHPQLAIGFLDQDHVREPSGIVGFFDKPRTQQFIGLGLGR